MEQPHIVDLESQEAGWEAIVHVAGDMDAPSVS
jgi:hypothetical protein